MILRHNKFKCLRHNSDSKTKQISFFFCFVYHSEFTLAYIVAKPMESDIILWTSSFIDPFSNMCLAILTVHEDINVKFNGPVKKLYLGCLWPYIWNLLRFHNNVLATKSIIFLAYCQ